MLLPLLWKSQLFYAGTIVKCGYTIYQVLFWVLLARRSYEDPRRTYLYFGMFYGICEAATAAARLFASLLVAEGAVDYEAVSSISLLSLWLISIFGMVFFGISSSWHRRSARAASSGARLCPSPRGGEDLADPCGSSLGAGVPDTPGAAWDEGGFATQIERFCADFRLSDREREILIETIHGYSMENIGRKLFISRETVRTHTRHIYQKAGVASKQELIALIDEL